METPKIPFECSRRSLKFLKDPDQLIIRDESNPFTVNPDNANKIFTDSISSRSHTTVKMVTNNNMRVAHSNISESDAISKHLFKPEVSMAQKYQTLYKLCMNVD